jgi:hypothetical protein
VGRAVTELSRHGIAVELPQGWEGAITWREAQQGETTHPVLHIGSFPLPPDRGDFGSGAVDIMTFDDVFVALLEYHPEAAGQALFAREGVPAALDPGQFSPSILQRQLPGHAGTQEFFTEAGRAFCLYAVLGAYRRRLRLVPRINDILPSIRITAS